MITRTIEIAKGVNLNYIHTDKFKTNLISFSFITQMNRSTAHLNAMIPLILMRGCEKYPTQSDLNKRLQYLYSADIGAKNDKLGEFQTFGFTANMLNDRFTGDISMAKEMATLLSEIIFKPYLEKGAFSRKYLKTEKVSLIDSIEAEINNKTRYSMNRCMEEMFKDEIFSVKKCGTVEDVENITANDLYSAYLNALSTYRIEIYVVGDCDIDGVGDIFASYLKDVKREVCAPRTYPIVRSADKVKRIDEVQDVNQGKLCIGMRTGKNISDGNYHVAQLFCEIYGGSPTSKLFMNVREKMSLCYFCRSLVNQRNGVLLIASGIEFKNKEIAERAILDQLEAIKNGDISAEELDNAKRSLRNGYMQIYDSAESMEAWILNRSLSENSDMPAEETKKLDSTGIEDIVSFAKGITLDTVYFLKGETEND